MTPKKFIYTTYQDLPLNLSFYPKKKPTSADQTILYIHGGGFIFGERDDLAPKYLEELLDSGFNILTLDYPLAPESPLIDIIECLNQAVEWFLTNYHEQLALSDADFFLFGRSAGGYLATLLTTYQYQQQIGLIRFYGYHDLSMTEFRMPNRFYNRLPKVAPMNAQLLIKNTPQIASAMTDRFPIYLSARQYGNWLTYLGPVANLMTTVDQSSKQFPSTFIVHCSKDPDIPVQASRDFDSSLADSVYFELNREEHDFDRTENIFADRIYQNLIDWLQEKIK